jgi:hypothetical protein
LAEDKPWFYIRFEHQYISKTTGQSQEWYQDETITQQHPLEFLREQREKHSENEHARYRYRLCFWSEIPEEIALKNKEFFT